MKGSPSWEFPTRLRAVLVLAALTIGAFAPASSRAQAFDPVTYRHRRDRVAQLAKDGIVVIQSVSQNQPGLTEYLIDDSDNHDFLFLTGVDTPNSTLLLLPQSTLYPEILFVPAEEIEAARARSGVATVLPADRLQPMLGDALTDFAIKRYTERVRKPVSTEMSRVLSLTPTKPFSFNYPRYVNLVAEPPARVQLASRLKTFAPKVELRDASPWLDAVRIRHDSADLAMIADVVRIGSIGLMAAMKACRPGALDEQVGNVAEYTFKREGASRLAYPSMIYISPFGRTVHPLSAAEAAKSSEPMSAVHRMESGDLVMIDAGAEYHHYASDISRTVPVSGKFTAEQRRLYEAVLAAHDAAIAVIRPGATFRQVHAAAVAALHAQGIDQYFTFGTSHFIGMDAHDAGNYDEPLQPGMIFTVEPGIIDSEKNIVIHVEDMILVTADGHKNLSAGIPIEVADVEKMMTRQ